VSIFNFCAQDEEDESFFSIAGLQRSNSKLEGQTSPSLSAFDPSIFSHISGLYI
jgi:hypothetical protein